MLSVLLFTFLLQSHPPIQIIPISCLSTFRFSPEGGVQDLLMAEIDKARKTIRIALYGLNNPLIVDSLIRAKARGVDVKIKLDKLQSASKNQKISINRLKTSGVSVQISNLSRLLHDKFMIIDGRKVWTGSYNWTTQAEERHRENVVVLECPEGATLYEEEWNKIELK